MGIIERAESIGLGEAVRIAIEHARERKAQRIADGTDNPMADKWDVTLVCRNPDGTVGPADDGNRPFVGVVDWVDDEELEPGVYCCFVNTRHGRKAERFKEAPND